MKFDVKPRGAGSAGAMLQDPAVARVYGAFGDGCLRCYNFDIRTKRRMMDRAAISQVRSFVQEYGVDDAHKIMLALFGVMHEGKWRGEVVGNSIFSKSRRWMADQLLIEAEQSGLEAREDDGFDHAEAGVKPSFT